MIQVSDDYAASRGGNHKELSSSCFLETPNGVTDVDFLSVLGITDYLTGVSEIFYLQNVV